MKRELPIYLDYMATTPVDPRVAERMTEWLTGDRFGNPASSTHAYGRRAAAAVETARAQVAALLDADPREVVWTSGATEANNLAIKGAAWFHEARGRHIVTARTEHKAVVDTCAALERRGFDITWLVPGDSGIVEPAQLESALREDTILVSLMHANNETGVVQDIAAFGEMTRPRGILLHVDAAQSAGKLPIDLATLPVDLMSFSGHKFYGPKGVGALYVRRRPRARIDALIHGGGHEGGLRSGTLATHQIVGMGAAARIAAESLVSEAERLRDLRDRLFEGLSAIPAMRLNGDRERRLPGHLSLAFECVHGESLLAALDPYLSVSSGSACTSASGSGSYVLRALGLPEALVESSLRLSLGRFTTPAEVERARACITSAVERLRTLSPEWLARSA
jgi:cysteine desulfurase